MKVYINRTPKTYYITLNGSDSNDGLGTGNGNAWRTLTYAMSAASPVLPGDTIFVKGGNYGNENVVFEKSGVPGSPITIIGYKTTPGDSPTVLINNVNPYASYTATEMPTYTGSSRATGTAFNMENAQYITMKNFQVTTYYRGFLLGFNTAANYDRISGHQFYNVNIMSMGDLGDGYSGFGFSAGLYAETDSNHVRANGNTFNSCLIVNPGAEGMLVCGDYNTLFGVKVYCNESANVLDYFINVAGSYNTLSNCYAEGTTGDFGGTHGIGFKSNSERTVDAGNTMPQVNPKYNNVYDCTSKNIGEGFYVRHRGCQYNTFKRCTAYGTHLGTDGTSGRGACVVIRDGASYNKFDSCFGKNLAAAILFQDTTEDGGASGGNNYNYITNCVFYNTYAGINFDSYNVAGDVGINTVSNCSFLYSRYLHICGRECNNMTYKNNIYYGNNALGYGGYFRGNTYSAQVVVGQFSNCVFYNIPSMPGGFVGTNSNIGTDPLFVSLGNIVIPANPDMHLQSGSPSKDAGTTLSYITVDYDGIARPIGSAPSIGAYER